MRMFGKRKKKTRGGILSEMLREIRRDKYAFFVFVLLGAVTLCLLIYSIAERSPNRVFTGTLTLLLLLIPAFVERNFKIRLPTALEILAYLFVFCAGVLGEIGGFYERYSFWDDLLHGCNGFMFAAFGFCLVALLTRGKGVPYSYPPSLCATIAFCFSMTVGALWELFEFGTDRILGTDMQKDSVIGAIHSVSLPAVAGERVAHVTDIERCIIFTKSGERVEIFGYLDIGLVDTMTDIFVNMLGTLLFCLIGYFYLRYRRGVIASRFIPVVEEE